jgi:hypothetical protein
VGIGCTAGWEREVDCEVDEGSAAGWVGEEVGIWMHCWVGERSGLLGGSGLYVLLAG